MKAITMYQCFDGTLYQYAEKADAHDIDTLGKELEGLLKLFAFGGKLTRIDEHRALFALVTSEDKSGLREACKRIADIIEFIETPPDIEE